MPPSAWQRRPRMRRRGPRTRRRREALRQRRRQQRSPRKQRWRRRRSFESLRRRRSVLRRLRLRSTGDTRRRERALVDREAERKGLLRVMGLWLSFTATCQSFHITPNEKQNSNSPHTLVCAPKRPVCAAHTRPHPHTHLFFGESYFPSIGRHRSSPGGRLIGAFFSRLRFSLGPWQRAVHLSGSFPM